MMPQKFLAALVSALLISCSATRQLPLEPTSPADLSRFVLVIQEQMERPLPRGYGSFSSPRKSGGKSEFCRGECQQAYDDCVELERLRPQEFSADGAVGWLKRHPTEVLVGSIIVIAGVTFVVISAGAGLLVLAPLVLVASSAHPSEKPVAVGTP